MRYSLESRDRRYAKGYGFLSFAKNIGKSISSKFSQKLQKTPEATGGLIGNKIADKITSVSKKSSKNLRSPELSSNEANNEIPKERYISPQERQQIID